ncbi:MAG: class I SAM-dependent methyltransferase [Legionellales bacterium]|nr:class I SAM-dependent methyltransferase [Legionellales bacterium]
MNKDYAFCFGEEDQSRLEILNDICNAESQAFLSPYIREGMNVLEVGAGHGHMIPWFLDQVGHDGSVTALDADNEQIKVIRSKIDVNKNLLLKVGSVYDLNALNDFDCIYCRFLFMHLDDPDRALKSMISKLNKNGILLLEEPTLSSNFCYPESKQYQEAIKLLLKLGETFKHDYDIGLKLITKVKNLGGFIKSVSFSQPVLYTKERKSILRLSLKSAAEKFINANLIGTQEFEFLLNNIESLETNNDYIFTLSRQTQIVAAKS